MKIEQKFTGLTDAELSASVEKHGKNVLKETKSTPLIKRYFAGFRDPIIKILLIALGITLILPGSGGLFEAAGIAVSILVSTLVSTLSEYGSERAFRKMQAESEKEVCTVIRNSVKKEIPITDIAVGDLVYLRAGERVPSDGFMVSGGISCDQSALNGESKEIQKLPGEEFKDDLSDRASVFRGSSVTAGDGIMKTVRIGEKSYYGSVANELQSESGESPLRKKLSVLAKTLSRFGYFCAVCVGLAELIYAFFVDKSFVLTMPNVMSEVFHALTLAVSIVVVAVPEGLPMMITVVLSSNVMKMQRNHVRVRRAVGIETAGSVNMLFTDKTGTLTYGRPRAVCYVTGDCDRASRASDLTENLRFLCGACTVSATDCEISASKVNGKFAFGGNGTDRALIDGYLGAAKYPKGLTRTALLPFDSRRKLSAASVQMTSGKRLTFVKGAPEILLGKCNFHYGGDGVKKPINRDRLRAELESMMRKGMRVVALVSSEATEDSIEKMNLSARENKEPDLTPIFANMTFIAFVGVRDELRREASKAVKELKGAGVSVIMITGDSALTAEAVARECGIIDKGMTDRGCVLESTELAKMSDRELAGYLPSLRVVARALPQDKSRLVRIARSLGYITAMTGDGLNDAPALKQADVGFAMGSGTEVAKEAGDIIITDDNIASIVRAVLYGRTIFKSIRKFVVFQLTMNLCAVGISIIGPFIGCESPVTVAQMLWINLIMDTLAALAFAGEAPMARYLKERPLKTDEPVLNGDMMTRIFVMGVYTVMLCLFYHRSSYIRGIFPTSDSDIKFLSGFFAMFVFCGIFGAFNARAPRLNMLSGLLINPVFVAVMSTVSTVQIAMIYYGGALFRCSPLSTRQLKTVIMLALTVIPVSWLLTLLMGKSQSARTALNSPRVSRLDSMRT